MFFFCNNVTRWQIGNRKSTEQGSTIATAQNPIFLIETDKTYQLIPPLGAGGKETTLFCKQDTMCSDAVFKIQLELGNSKWDFFLKSSVRPLEPSHPLYISAVGFYCATSSGSSLSAQHELLSPVCPLLWSTMKFKNNNFLLGLHFIQLSVTCYCIRRWCNIMTTT